MKKIAVILLAMSLSVFSVLIGVCSVLGMYHFGKYSEYEGHLQYLEENKEIVLMTLDAEPIDLSFYYDIEDDFIIDDFDKVKVSGYYIGALNLLRVEEIGTSVDVCLL